MPLAQRAGEDVVGVLPGALCFYPDIIFQIPRKKCPLAISSMPGSTPPWMPPEIIMLRSGAPAEEFIIMQNSGFS